MKSLKVIKHKVGSKLFLSGEYAITQEKKRSIVMHIPKYTTATITSSSQLYIYSSLFKEAIHSLQENKDYQLIIDTIIFVKRYLKEQSITFQPFKLIIDSELYHNKQKYGLGSSGSVVVLVIKTVLEFHNIMVSKLDLFKLCSIFLTLRNDNGSFADIACIIFETMIIYRNFNRNFIDSTRSIQEILKDDFNSLQIIPYQFPFPLNLSVVWSKISASSAKLVNEITLNPQFIAESEQLIDDYLTCKTWDRFTQIIHKNRIHLQNLSEKIEITSLQEICDNAEKYQLSAKSSGAGGGDCAIVFYQNKQHYTAFIQNINYPVILEVTYE